MNSFGSDFATTTNIKKKIAKIPNIILNTEKLHIKWIFYHVLFDLQFFFNDKYYKWAELLKLSWNINGNEFLVSLVCSREDMSRLLWF